jgi:hypothetical protein
MIGPATHWSHIGRDGRWCALELPENGADAVAVPVLDRHQFAFLVADSSVDEMLVLLADRGVKVFRYPSHSHVLLTIALRAAQSAQLPEEAQLDWCEWFWRQDGLHDDTSAASMLHEWRTGITNID